MREHHRMSFNALIVDDSNLVRASLRNLIDISVGASTIREAGTLSQALVGVERHPPALVILDLNMPDGFGLDFIQLLKALSPTSRIAVVTILADAEYRQHSLALGADWFFDKLTELGPLLEAICPLARSNVTKNPDKGNLHE